VDDVVSGDQEVLLDASSRFMEQEYPLKAVRAHGYDDPTVAASYRRRAGELGWYSMLVPEALGGGSVSGNGPSDAALIAYRRGRALQPGSFVGTNVVAYAIAQAGTSEQRENVLPDLVTGARAGAWLGLEPTGEPPFLVTNASDGFLLSGGPALAQEADRESWLLVGALTRGGDLAHFLLRADTPGVTVVPVESLDISRRFSRVSMDGVKLSASLSGSPSSAEGLAGELLAIGCVLTAAESVGAIDRDMEVAVQYAKDRIAFGRPIGSFQAIKHLLADSSLMLEMTKSVTLAAATSLGQSAGYHLESASIAKALVGDCAIEVAQNCFQVFGGIGFTWEHDQHLYLRRVTTDAALYGNSSWHRERLCQLAGL
jgi:alkylation response protein AidB-like acyl-CoA dehydrogenase